MELMLVGLALMISTPFFLTLDTPTSNDCAATLWVFGVGFILAFSSLFLRTYRIYRIFETKVLKTTQTRTLTDLKLFMFVVAFVSIELLFLSLWQGLDPLVPHQYIIIDSNGDQMRMTHCTSDHFSTFLYTMAAWKGLLMICGCLLTYSARRVHLAFNESKYIGLSLYSFFFILLLIFPITLLITDLSSIVFIISFGLLVIVLTTTSFMFIPKFLLIWRKVDKAMRTDLTKGKDSFDSHDRDSKRSMASPSRIAAETQTLRSNYESLLALTRASGIAIPSTLELKPVEPLSPVSPRARSSYVKVGGGAGGSKIRGGSKVATDEADRDKELRSLPSLSAVNSISLVEVPSPTNAASSSGHTRDSVPAPAQTPAASSSSAAHAAASGPGVNVPLLMPASPLSPDPAPAPATSDLMNN